MDELAKLCAGLREAQIKCLIPSRLPPGIVKGLSEIPVAARLYERRTARCVYRRASVTSAEGEPLIRLADLGDALLFALLPPEGWVMVPEQLPVEMEVAFMEAWVTKRRCIDDPEMQDAWSAALAARPQVEP